MAEEYVQYEPAEALGEPKKKNTGLIIGIVVAVALILCCCCLVALGIIFGEDIVNQLSRTLPLLLTA
ncbi:MAG: hypothetical protein JXD18_10235 [Anaerolineae bacterium]|nr:hypothetical protein [Anaerolineae bacterium]